MTKDRNLALEDRARLTEIQDLLLERIIERKEAIERGQDVRAKVLENEIKDLKREKENIRKWITVGSA
jgi:DNA-directed RNA polymerase subunit E'/Rpb7